MLIAGRVGSRVLPWLAAMAVAFIALHHVGVAMAWLGSVGETRWADWIDLLTPYAFLLTAAGALWAGQADARAWGLFLVGAITYTEGHGIHLAANSVGNVLTSDIGHLWDEVVGHYVWYGGMFLVFAALGLALARREDATGVIGIVLAVLVGATVGTNSLEGGTAVFSIVAAAAFSVWGWQTRHTLGRLLLVTFGTTLVVLLGFGIWQRGFPQPSDLGWI